MSSYRYVVFPRGKQPAPAEVRDLQTFAAALAGRFAWGTCRHDGRLALAFDRAAYDHVAANDPGLEQLVARWQSRGCDLLERLAFVKDATALQPGQNATLIPQAARDDAVVVTSYDPIAAKQRAAQMSAARSLLAVEKTLQRYALIQRTAAVLPYLFIAGAALGTFSIGLYLRDRLLKSDHEPRQETIERMAGASELPQPARKPR